MPFRPLAMCRHPPKRCIHATFVLCHATAPAYTGPPPTKDDQTMAMLCYILGIVTGWLGPLIIWLIKKETSPFVNDQGKEVLNWELTILIGYFVFMFVGCIPFIHILGLLGILAIIVSNVVFCILGAIKTNQGAPYRFPFSIKFIK